MFILDNKTDSNGSHRWRNFALLLSSIIHFFIVLGGGTAEAGELVHGEYLSSSGKVIQLSITTGTPPPSHIIVAQIIPPGVKVDRTQPEAQKISISKGKVKWLLKKVQSGSQTLSITLSKQIDHSTISATLRYRDPVTGRYIESLITP